VSVDSLDRFAAPLGVRERWSTLAAVVLSVAGLTLAGLVLAFQSGDVSWMLLGLPFTLALFVMARLAPSGYALAGDGVHIERRIGPRVIPYRSIRAVDRAPRRVGGLSVTGSKGIFGRFGRFWNTELGLYRLYLSNTDAVVWLDTTDGLVGLSPDRPDEFVDRLRGRLGAR
jgi:hypothetical protein